MYFEQLQFALIIPKIIESLLFLFNIILLLQKYHKPNWDEIPRVEKNFLIGMIGWFIYITLDIFIFYFAPASLESADIGIYQGYLSGYISLTIVNVLRDIAFAGALIQLWFYFYASLTIWVGESKAHRLMNTIYVRFVIIVISVVILAYDQIKVEITPDGPIVNADYQNIGAFVIFLFILLYFFSSAILIYSLSKEKRVHIFKRLKIHIVFLIFGILLMGIGNLYWLILGMLEQYIGLSTTLIRFVLTFIGHLFWMLSPILIYFGFFQPIEVSPKIDQDYNKIGMQNFRKLVDEKILAMFLVKNNKIIYANPLMTTLLKYSNEELIKMDLEKFELYIHPEDKDLVIKHNQMINSGEIDPFFYEFRYITKQDEILWVKQITYPIFEYDIPIFQYIFSNISDRKKMESEKKILQGLLPICSKCKKIRDDEGYYIQIEQYLFEHIDLEFTHGYCPDCMAEIVEAIEKSDNHKDETIKNDLLGNENE